jgi:hypothetical protein
MKNGKVEKDDLRMKPEDKGPPKVRIKDKEPKSTLIGRVGVDLARQLAQSPITIKEGQTYRSPDGKLYKVVNGKRKEIPTNSGKSKRKALRK